MQRIPETVIDELLERADIIEIIGRYLPLKQAGREWIGRCPFHADRTPSFGVNREKQLYHCFGCGAGGNTLSFLMQHERLDFLEAVELLAERVGVRLPRDRMNGPARSVKEAVDLLQQVALFYQERLRDDAGRVARAYLTERGVTASTAAAWQLGYAPPGPQACLEWATRRGLPQAALERAGVVARTAQGTVDRFRDRLIFPIRDARGRIVAFGGRALSETVQPKYLNSPDTELYRKGRQLFGLSAAKTHLTRATATLIVEGYLDCIVLHQSGFPQTVSPLGTALTEEQIRLLRRYTSEVILLFDADTAGEAATLRELDPLLAADLRARVATLPRGSDPDEFVLRQGPAALEERLQAAVPLFDAKLERLRQREGARTTPEGRVAIAQEMLTTVARIENALLRSEYLKRLSETLHLDPAALQQELRKLPRSPHAAAPRQASAPGGRSTHTPEHLLLGVLLHEPAWGGRLKGLVDPAEFTDERLRTILQALLEAPAGALTPARLTARFQEPEDASLIAELLANVERLPDHERLFRDCVQRLQERRRHHRLLDLQARIQQAEARKEQTQLEHLMQEYHVMLRGDEHA